MLLRWRGGERKTQLFCGGACGGGARDDVRSSSVLDELDTTVVGSCFEAGGECSGTFAADKELGSNSGADHSVAS
jgi:hypothetical protein